MAPIASRLCRLGAATAGSVTATALAVSLVGAARGLIAGEPFGELRFALPQLDLILLARSAI